MENNHVSILVDIRNDCFASLWFFCELIFFVFLETYFKINCTYKKTEIRNLLFFLDREFQNYIRMKKIYIYITYCLWR